MDLSRIAAKFDIPGRLVAIHPTGRGNVNDTYMAVFRTTFSEERAIIQRINRRVFSRPDWVMDNMRMVTAHVHRRLEREADLADRIWQLPRVIPCKNGKHWFVDEEGEYWRAITLIASAVSYDTAQGAEHALEAGAVLGQFHRLISDMDPRRLHDTLAGFHVTPMYLRRYDATVAKKEGAKRLKASVEARRLSQFIDARRSLAEVLEKARAARKIHLRPIHGDPKVTNIMIDEFTAKGTSIVDLDTVKPGLVQYDFGDALRSIGNPGGEEADKLTDVFFDVDICESFVKGYMSCASDFLTVADKAYLFDSIRLLAFELGLRFFQDYLAGNVYFKVRYEEQNLKRARVQFRLCESIEAREKMIRQALEVHT